MVKHAQHGIGGEKMNKSVVSFVTFTFFCVRARKWKASRLSV